MMLPVKPITRSALLDGQQNGLLDPSVLLSTPGQAGGPAVVLVVPAARSWRALAAAALAAGHVLKATGPADSYRRYEVQLKIFLARYQTAPIPTTDRKWWNGRWWYKKPGVAVAAAPGTSNHGWAQAVDTGEEIDGDAGTERIDAETLAWLVANYDRYGWSHELQSERWHIHYWAGDAVPAAVLEYEAGQQPQPPGGGAGEEVNVYRIDPVEGADGQLVVGTPFPTTVVLACNDFGIAGGAPGMGAAVRAVWNKLDKTTGKWIWDDVFDNQTAPGELYVPGDGSASFTTTTDVRTVVITHLKRAESILPVHALIYRG